MKYRKDGALLLACLSFRQIQVTQTEIGEWREDEQKHPLGLNPGPSFYKTDALSPSCKLMDQDGCTDGTHGGSAYGHGLVVQLLHVGICIYVHISATLYKCMSSVTCMCIYE